MIVVKHLHIEGILHDISLTVGAGERVGIIGESGSGKSVTALSIMGLSDLPAEGSITVDGTEMVGTPDRVRRRVRGTKVAMVFQEPMTALDPLKKIGKLVSRDLLRDVGVDRPDAYPHELSGGQRQRVLIAMALTRDPKLVIADEPTTALDVTVQKQVVDLLNRLKDELGFAMVFVSHDLALVSQLADRLTVMYAGQVMEQGSNRQILVDPRHEYTRGLLGSVLSIEAGAARLHQVQGTVPSPRDFAPGDRFAPGEVVAHCGSCHRAIPVSSEAPSSSGSPAPSW